MTTNSHATKVKNLLTFLFILINTFFLQAQNNVVNQEKVAEDLNKIITEIKNNYIYLKDKKLDIDCIEQTYTEKTKQLKTNAETVLFFEYLLDEFYDSHIMLMTNNESSYRLHSSLYAIAKDGKFYVKNLWQTRMQSIELNILNSEIMQFNGIEFSDKINAFPTFCTDKNDPKVREWIANKVLSGRYNEPRKLSLKLENGNLVEFDMDQLQTKRSNGLLAITMVDNIGVIRFNNSLGNNELIQAFDRALDSLHHTKGLILDLRNTVSGGNSYVARGIMSRFIDKDLPYQKHQIFDEKWDNTTAIKRSWAEYVSPRGKQYKKPLVVLVNRWTGSMGEGMAIGFDGLHRAKIVGTEMKRLAGGSTKDFKFVHQRYNYKLITEKMFHINGTPREKFVPEFYVIQTSISKDQILEKGLELINQLD